jgi:hypothetical protein
MNSIQIEIVQTFGLPESPRTETIELGRVREWLALDDIKSNGIMFSYLNNQRYANRISPALPEEEFFNFCLRYFELCLREDSDDEWLLSKYEAAWIFVGLFNRAWSNPGLKDVWVKK